MEVMIKNSAKKTCERKHCKIQKFFQKEGEDYDNNLFQIYLLSGIRIIRMVIESLCGVSDLFSIMHDYSDGVWLREMMQLMQSDDTDSDDGACDLIMR
jgi:hypothetical protein